MLRGRSGGPAAIRSKYLKQVDAQPSFWVSFEEDKKMPQEWEALFERARLAQVIGEEARLIGGDKTGRVGPLKYITPRKMIRQQFLRQDFPIDESWEGVSTTSLPVTPEFVAIDLSLLNSSASGAGKDVNIKRALRGLQEKFVTLRKHLSAHTARLTVNFSKVANRLNLMAVESLPLGCCIGDPEGFGAEDAVTTSFHGLCYLNEQFEMLTKPFAKVAYALVVEKLDRVESDLGLLNTAVANHDAAEQARCKIMSKVEANQKQTVKNFKALKTRFIGPMAKIYGKGMHQNGTVFECWGLVEAVVKGMSDDGNLFRAVSFMGGLTDTGEFGSLRQVQELEKQMLDLECRNVELTTELESLKEHSTSAVANQISAEPQDGRVNGLLAQLCLLEVQVGESICIGTYSFNNVLDCEAFLSSKVPSTALSAYCYDMVLLVNCVPKNDITVPPKAILQHDYTVHKGEFTHVGSAFIYSSMQQVLPGPLA
jgi:hypothetical protein